MTAHNEKRLGLVHSLIGGWRTFWFKPQPVYALGVARIGFGALSILWTFALLPDLRALFGEHGAMSQNPADAYGIPAPLRPPGPFGVSVLDLCHNDVQLLLVWAVLLLSSLALTVGWHTKIASILILGIIHGFTQGYGVVFNAGDSLLTVEALVIALSPAGAALSLDQQRRAGSFWSPQIRSPWAVRMLQVQMAFIYLIGVRGKLSGTTWIDGTAVAYAWRRDLAFVLLPPPEWLYDNALLVNIVTWGALAIEFALGVLVWNRRCRPWVLLAGVGLHLGIFFTMDTGIFTFAIFVLYLAFIPFGTIQRMISTTENFLNNKQNILRRYRKLDGRPPASPVLVPENAAAENDRASSACAPTAAVDVVVGPRDGDSGIDDSIGPAVIGACSEIGASTTSAGRSGRSEQHPK